MGQQFTNLKCRGLFSFPNRLQSMPAGALVTASNVVVNREDIIEPRRGNKVYGNAMGSSPSTDNAHQLFIYKNRLLRHFGGSGAGTTLQWDNGSETFSSFSGTFAETETGLRMKGIEVNGNFFLTTSTGIRKISATSAALMGSSTVGNAGGVKALDGYAELNEQTGFFTQDSTVSYRIVWGIKDNNDNVIIGTPSERIIVTNSITDLLIKDFNLLLVTLDANSPIGGDNLSDTDYSSLWKVPLNSATTTLQTNMSAVCTKLNTDFGNTDFSAAKTAIDAVTLSASPTTTQLETLQEQFDVIVDILNAYIVGGSEIDSSATEFSNSTQSATVDLTFTIPSDITTAHFYQIYRTNLATSTGSSSLSDQDPGDEHKLSYEANPTAGEITAGTITVQDIVPESFLGANLYTNPTSGEGILQANEIPPYAKDIALFRGFTFYANTKTKHRLDISLLSVSELTSGTSTITISDGTTTTIYNFVEDEHEITDVICTADTAGSLNDTYFFLNSAENETLYYVWYNVNSAGTDPAISGRTGIEIAIATGAADTVVATATYDALNTYDDFTVAINTATVTIANSNAGYCDDTYDNDTGFTFTQVTDGLGENTTVVTRTGDTNSNTTISNLSHTRDITVGMFVSGTGIPTNTKVTAKTSTTVTLSAAATATDVGVSLTFRARDVLLSELATPSQQVDETARSLVRVINKQSTEVLYAFYLSGPDDVPGEMLFEAKTLSDTDFYVIANSATTGGQFSPALPTSGQTVISTNEVSPNRIYFSKKDQPEAVPILNYQDVGPKDKQILRIIALRDSLFVLKEEGVYRLSGESSPFLVTLFDSSTILKGVDTPAVLNNQIYLLSSQGVATISDTGVSIISRPIEDLLIKLTKPEFTSFSKASWGVGYESDRAYYLHTVTATSDTKATQCFRYNVFTNTWTILDLTKTCGIVNLFDDKMYLGAADINYTEQERKSFDRTDYADREYSDTISSGGIDGVTITLSSVANYEIGDILTQTQYLTISQFNRLLIKLDNDTGVNDTDYYSTLGGVVGIDLKAQLDLTAAKLDADSGVTDTDYEATISGYTNSFSDTQDAFNDIVTKLNSDTGVAFGNYSESSDTVTFEVRIVDVDSVQNTITIESSNPFRGIAGAIVIYKHFTTEIEWAPEKMGDVSVSKHASEATLIFEQSTFTNGTMSFGSDLSPNFEEIDFDGDGTGIYGNFTYGEGNYGGTGNSIPFRTLVPMEKQRCRFLKLKFEHAIARELFSVYGYSVTAEASSQRAFR